MYAIRLLLAVAAAAVALGPRQEADIVPGKYIISLKQDAEPPTVESHLSWVRGLHDQSLDRRRKNGIDKVWKDSFKGYSGGFDEGTLEEIRQRDDVRGPSSFSHIQSSDVLGSRG